MNEPAELALNKNWRLSVISLRIGLAGLLIAALGLLLSLTGNTSWVLSIGVIWWLITVVITLVTFFMARHDLGEKRPGLWSMRMMLARNALGKH
jgi:hypothetical protein